MIDKVNITSRINRTTNVVNKAGNTQKEYLSSEQKLLEQFTEEFELSGITPTKELIESKIINHTLTSLLGAKASKEPKYKELFNHIRQQVENSDQAQLFLAQVLSKLR